METVNEMSPDIVVASSPMKRLPRKLWLNPDVMDPAAARSKTMSGQKSGRFSSNLRSAFNKVSGALGSAAENIRSALPSAGPSGFEQLSDQDDLPDHEQKEHGQKMRVRGKGRTLAGILMALLMFATGTAIGIWYGTRKQSDVGGVGRYGDTQINDLLAENEQLMRQLDVARMRADISYLPHKQRQPKPQTMTKQQVRDMFLETLPAGQFEIEDIGRDIQLLNVPDQTQKYELNLELKCNQLGRTRDQVEKYLWHGAPYAVIQAIIQNGFDRSFNVQGMYGQGNYFAQDAEYSATERYSPVHTDGYKRMLLCKVIVGEMARGGVDPRDGRYPKISLKRDNTEFDTFVDYTGEPSIFASYRDFMAIPMYLLKFKEVDA